jgi:uncharacterized protein (TIGR03437 family)
VTRSRAIAISATVGVSVAVLLAHYGGPDAGYTTAPGDHPPNSCIYTQCHVGTVNSGGGNVVVNFPNGLTYTPGVQQTLTIVVTDSAAKLFGFELTARESNNATAQPGDFTAAPGTQIVLCSAGFGDPGSFKPSGACPTTQPFEYITHYLQPYKTNTIQVLWTPPATDVGNIHFYIAANAAPSSMGATGASPNSNDHIYTADYVLTPPAAAPCSDSTPSIATVQSAGAFNPAAGLASGTWLEIYGSNLTCTQARGWAGTDFSGNNAPTKLNNVSVSIDGIPAYVDYVSSGQVNVQAPDDKNTGAGMPIFLTNGAGASNMVSMQKNSTAPALLAPSSFNVQGHQWVVAQHANGNYVGKAGLISGLTFSPAKPGETIVIYGIGFGPVMNPSVASGTITPSTNPLNTLVTTPVFRFNQTQATLPFDGLAPGYVGLYQFNVMVPNVSAGDMPLNVTVGSVTLNQNLYITVGN